MNNWYILALFIVIGLGVFYFIFNLPKAPVGQVAVYEEKKAECKDGQKQSCSSNGCDGQRICVDGRWKGCNINRICKPGSKAPCVENACIIGYKICNECGTGHGGCNYLNGTVIP